MNYQEFIAAKTHYGEDSGFEPLWIPDFLFDFQKHLVSWATRKGRCGIFADCGLGKTPMQLVWAKNVYRKTGKPALIIAPLAVSAQTTREAAKFGIDVHRSRDGGVFSPITITNYERLHLFSPLDFGGCVCDESSILKSFNGARRGEITSFMRKIPYRLLTTATAAPNDYIELGTSSEALGYLGYMDMLNRFFKNDNNNSSSGGRMYGEAVKWRFKGHAELSFWRWVTSWARAVRRPSDLGFNDDGFILPALVEQEHIVDTEKKPDGFLFNLPAVNLQEQRDERKRTVEERCEYIAGLVKDTGRQAIVWCNLNDEGKLLSRLIPDATEIRGSDSDDKKEGAFIGFADNEIRILITKPKIGAWGLNFQNCSHICLFPTHSYEQYYQAVRRCWRFGQKNPVQVDLVMTEGDKRVMANLKRKSGQADEMFTSLVREMNDSIRISGQREYNKTEEIPLWL